MSCLRLATPFFVVFALMVVISETQGAGNSKCCATNPNQCSGCAFIGNTGPDGKPPNQNIYIKLGTNSFNICVQSSPSTLNCTNDLGLKACFSVNVQTDIYSDSACTTKSGTVNSAAYNVDMCTCKDTSNSLCGCK
jgi:hypothetical protein